MLGSRRTTRRVLSGILAVVVLLTAGAVVAIYRDVTAASGGRATRQARDQAARLDRVAAVAEADVSLATIQADVASDAGQDRPVRRLRHLRDQLATSLGGAAASEDASWAEIEAAVTRLEEQVRRGDPAAGDTAAALRTSLGAIGP